MMQEAGFLSVMIMVTAWFFSRDLRAYLGRIADALEKKGGGR